MRKLYSLFIAAFIFVNCSKQSDIKITSETISNLSNNVTVTNIADLPPDEDDGKKKYAERICYDPGNPNDFGTECNIPGTSCKQYDCTLSSASGISTKLTPEQMVHYATLDVETLLRKGLIGTSDVERFKSVIRNAMLERNKSLPNK